MPGLTRSDSTLMDVCCFQDPWPHFWGPSLSFLWEWSTLETSPESGGCCWLRTNSTQLSKASLMSWELSRRASRRSKGRRCWRARRATGSSRRDSSDRSINGSSGTGMAGPGPAKGTQILDCTSGTHLTWQSGGVESSLQLIPLHSPGWLSTHGLILLWWSSFFSGMKAGSGGGGSLTVTTEGTGARDWRVVGTEVGAYLVPVPVPTTFNPSLLPFAYSDPKPSILALSLTSSNPPWQFSPVRTAQNQFQDAFAGIQHHWTAGGSPTPLSLHPAQLAWVWRGGQGGNSCVLAPGIFGPAAPSCRLRRRRKEGPCAGVPHGVGADLSVGLYSLVV